MPRYIDAVNFGSRLRAVAERSLQKDYNQFIMEETKSETAGLLRSIEILNSQHTADVQEVRHGRWIDKSGDFVCSVCGWAFSGELPYMARKRDAKTEEIMRYCMHCGAKMNGGEEDAEQQAETDNNSETG